MQNIWAVDLVRGHDTSLLCYAISQTLICGVEFQSLAFLLMPHAVHGVSFPGVCVPFCPCFTAYSTQLHIIIVVLPVVFLFLYDIFFSEFRVVERKYKARLI